MRVLRILFLVLSMLPWAFAGSPVADWVRQPAFSVDAPTLRAIAKAEPPTAGKGVLELLEDYQFTIDAQGRTTTRYRYVFRVDHESALDGWRNITALWKPWNQERPVLRARVITPDGLEHRLDPTTLVETPVQDDANLFDDRKRLAAPLPQLCLGAIVEVETLTRETAPTFPSGTRLSVTLIQPVTVLQSRVVVDIAAGVPVQHKLIGVPGAKVSQKAEGGGTRLLLELGRMEAREDLENHEPSGHRHFPGLVVTTVRDWQSAARSYRDLVERQLAGADLGSRLPAGIAQAKGSRAKAALILDELHRQIKYTGLELKDANVVPRSPAEVYARGYGDCKDKAALLVGLLRAAGVTAHVALLRTGPGQDIEESMPGMNGFDHAIVHVEGPDPFWIDATASLFRPGELPFPDQGRLALIAKEGTSGLVTTPVSASADNVSRETREVFLADSGPARVVESSAPTGLAEAYFRHELFNDEPKKLREGLKKYAVGHYEAKELGAVEMPDPRDMSRPFTLRLEALEADIGHTWDFNASLTVNLWNMTERLRRYVPVASDKAQEQETIRKQPFLLPEPYAVAWDYRIHIPDGFKARPLPEAATTTFGPATLTQAFELTPEGLVVAKFRFDSGKRLWSAEEFEAARKALGEFGRSAPISLGFDLEAEVLLAAGRIPEAIQAYRSYVARHPGKAEPLGKLAMAELKGGMGESARDLARKACQLEPRSVFAHRTLGYVLLHDEVGREFKKGWDRAGTIKALQEAKRLDPSDRVARKNLAIVLEYDGEGTRYGRTADLDAAIAEYQDLRKALKVTDLDVNLMICLARRGRGKELESMASGLAPSPTRSSWMLVAAALNRGLDRALAEAPGLIPETSARRTAFLSAGEQMLPLRRYQEAAGFLSAGAPGASDAPSVRARAAFFAKTRRFEEVPLDPAAPGSVVWELLRDAIVGGKKSPELAQHLTPDLRALLQRDPESELLEDKAGAGLGSLRQLDLPREAAFDLLQAVTQVGVEGTEALGFKVQLQGPDSTRLVFRVSRLGASYRIAGLDERYSHFGVEALRRLKLGDLAGARAWLDSAREVAWCGDNNDPLSGNRFCRFWTKGQAASAEEIRLAAMVLQATDPHAVDTVRFLEAQRKGLPPERQLDLDLALSAACFATRDYARLEVLSRALLERYPDSKVASGNLNFALSGQRKWAEMIVLNDALLKRRPEDLSLVGNKGHALGAQGRMAEKLALLKGVVDRGQARSSEYNNLAWARLLAGKADDESVDLARRALLLEPGNVGTEHTLACILAERGEVGEALELLMKMLRASDTGEPRSQDWLIFGRIAEHLGEKELALARYARVEPPKGLEVEEDSCHLLARRRMEALGR